MRLSIALWVVLAIVGLLGAFRFSALFFGLFTVSLLLCFYNYKMEDETALPLASSPANVASLICPNCGISLEVDAFFCQQCGREVRKG